MSHVAFVHHDNLASFQRHRPRRCSSQRRGIRLGRHLPLHPRRTAQLRVQQFGMPNVFYMTALPTDPEIGWQESLFWWVPIDDTQPHAVQPPPRSGDRRSGAIDSTRGASNGARTIDLRASRRVRRRSCAGELALRDVDTSRVDLVRLQDDIAQVGQGRIADREAERPGAATSA